MTFPLHINQTLLKMLLMFNDNNSFMVTNQYLYENYKKFWFNKNPVLENLNFFLLYIIA